MAQSSETVFYMHRNSSHLLGIGQNQVLSGSLLLDRLEEPRKNESSAQSSTQTTNVKTEKRLANLGDFLFRHSEPQLASSCIQLFRSEMLFLHRGQRSIMGKLGKDFIDERTVLIQEFSFSAFLLFLHFF